MHSGLTGVGVPVEEPKLEQLPEARHHAGADEPWQVDAAGLDALNVGAAAAAAGGEARQPSKTGVAACGGGRGGPLPRWPWCLRCGC